MLNADLGVGAGNFTMMQYFEWVESMRQIWAGS